MNRRPSRFRPRLEALEDRSLLSVSVSLVPVGFGMALTIDASQSTAHNVISIFNHGNGHITGGVTGDPDGAGDFAGGTGFFNVREVIIKGGNGGAAVYYFQQGGDADNPSGDQVYSPGLYFQTEFARGDNTFFANLNGHALRTGSIGFAINGGGGTDDIAIGATNVNIAAGTRFTTIVDDSFAPRNANVLGVTSFLMTWSGVKRGGFSVSADGGNDGITDFNLGVAYLGAPLVRALRGQAAFGAAPGDLVLNGGLSSTRDEMIIQGSSGLPLTGDLYGGPSDNLCTRTANVKVHGLFYPDVVIGLIP
jgi:hypothetical protein